MYEGGPWSHTVVRDDGEDRVFYPSYACSLHHTAVRLRSFGLTLILKGAWVNEPPSRPKTPQL